jgi:hypothetical protein
MYTRTLVPHHQRHPWFRSTDYRYNNSRSAYLFTPMSPASQDTPGTPIEIACFYTRIPYARL